MKLTRIIVSLLAVFITHTTFGMLVQPSTEKGKASLAKRVAQQKQLRLQRAQEAKKQSFAISIQNNAGVDIKYKTTENCEGNVSTTVKNRETPRFGTVEFDGETKTVIIKDEQNNPIENLCIEYSSLLFNSQILPVQLSHWKNTIQNTILYNAQHNTTQIISGFQIIINQPNSRTKAITKEDLELTTLLQGKEAVQKTKKPSTQEYLAQAVPSALKHLQTLPKEQPLTLKQKLRKKAFESIDIAQRKKRIKMKRIETLKQRATIQECRIYIKNESSNDIMYQEDSRQNAPGLLKTLEKNKSDYFGMAIIGKSYQKEHTIIQNKNRKTIFGFALLKPEGFTHQGFASEFKKWEQQLLSALQKKTNQQIITGEIIITDAKPSIYNWIPFVQKPIWNVEFKIRTREITQQ